MGNQLTELQDLTLDFIGSQEYLILLPKPTDQCQSLSKLPHSISPGNAIVAQKITSETSVFSPANQNNEENSQVISNENLDSQAYKIGISANPQTNGNLTSFSHRLKDALKILENKELMLSKESLLKNFNIVGVLNAQKLGDSPDQKPSDNTLNLHTYLDIFPEFEEQLKDWIQTNP